MAVTTVTFFLVGIVTITLLTQLLPYCYVNDENPYKLFASKTSYEEIRGKDENVVVLRGCSPVLFYYLSRHGTRYPSDNDRILLKNRLPELRKMIIDGSKVNLCSEDYDAVKRWVLPFDDECRDLTVEGQLEQTRIAERFLKRFPDFRNVENYDVRYMSGIRILSSLRGFLKGIWKNRDDLWSKIELRNDDEMLHFDKKCPKWSRNQNSTFGKVEKIVSKHLSTLSLKIGARLGLSGKIVSDDVDIMYNACRYETAWFPTKKSPWCVVFDKSDLELLEFDKDVEFYVKYGYDDPINYEQSCPIVDDIVDNFESIAIDPKPKMAIRFTHSGAIVKLLTRLGFANEKFEFDKMSKRKWRTSYLDPFSSNLCLILFKCDSQFKLMTYLQENLIPLPVKNRKCPIPCPLHFLLDHYKTMATNCNVTNICQ